MRKLLAVALLLMSTTVFADRIDNMNEQGVEGWCMNETEIIGMGLTYHRMGAPRVFKPVTDDMRAKAFLAMEAGENYVFPKEAMWYDPKDLNDRELKFLTEYIFKGWDYGIIPDEAASTFLNEYFEECLVRRKNQKPESDASGTGAGKKVNAMADHWNKHRQMQ